MSNQVIVFIDYQNITASACDRFPQTAGLRAFTHINPLRLAELVVARRHVRSELAEVRIYRGRPNPNRQPGAAAVNDIQASRWEIGRAHV